MGEKGWVRMKEILIVAPYQELYETAMSMIQLKNYENVEVVSSDLCSSADVDSLMVDEGVSVIISRGGTYTLIKNRLKNVSVIEIETSAYDIMSSIQAILDKREPAAVLGFDNIIYGVELLEGLKGLNIHKVKLDKTVPIAETIEKCAEEGIKVFIGDTLVERTCNELGYECHLIKNNIHSLVTAVERAQEIIMVAKNEIERNKRFAALMDCVREGVIATDEDNKVVEYNAVAREILGVDKNKLLGYTANEIFGEMSTPGESEDEGRPVVDEIRNLNGNKVTIMKVPIMVKGENKGYVAVFQDVKKLQNYERKVRSQLLGDGFVARYTFEDIIHISDEMRKTINVAKKFSAYNSSVLIQGSSGVGKELFAQSIHNVSSRRKGPFVAVNCAALPPSLIESELFGYEEGAFTGSKKGGRAGMFELAHKGTIFLDEISELPLDIQGRLLRVIQEKEIMRLGDNKIIPLDIRIVCATNRDLKEMVAEGKFREDLLFRINTLVFYIPRLNERRDDIEVLAEVFLEKYCLKYGKEITSFSKGAIKHLRGYDYQGNVRELQSFIERAVIICETDQIEVNDFNDIVKIMEEDNYLHEEKDILSNNEVNIFEKNMSLKDLEEKYIDYVYNFFDGSVKKTCQVLKIDRSTLWRKKKAK